MKNLNAILLVLTLFMGATLFAQPPASTDLNWDPQINFEKTTHDFGQLTEGQEATFKFKFINKEKFPILITDAKTSCGCTVPSYPKQPIPPGKTSEITVKYDTKGKSGSFNKDVTLTLSDASKQKTGSKVLNIVGSVSPKK